MEVLLHRRRMDISFQILPSAAWIVGEYSSLIEEATSMESDTADGEDEDELFQYSSLSLGTYHAIIHLRPKRVPTRNWRRVYPPSMPIYQFTCKVRTRKCSNKLLLRFIS